MANRKCSDSWTWAPSSDEADCGLETIPSDKEGLYARIIDSILAASDLTTISAKRIRKGLQTAVDHDIDPYKVRPWNSLDSGNRLRNAEED
jgi:hypothetical protein